MVVNSTKSATSFANGMLPRTHGSALFTRGETQGLVVTLGTGDDEQMIDALEGTYKSNFLCTTTSRPTRSVKWAALVPPVAANRPR